jgi:hypothetical protein
VVVVWCVGVAGVFFTGVQVFAAAAAVYWLLVCVFCWFLQLGFSVFRLLYAFGLPFVCYSFVAFLLLCPSSFGQDVPSICIHLSTSAYF